MQNKKSTQSYCHFYPKCRRGTACRFAHPETSAELKEWRSSMFQTCERCRIKLQGIKAAYCVRSGCANSRKWTPFFSKIMGFSVLPSSCIPRGSDLKASCGCCRQTKLVKFEVWRKSTRLGRLDFLCKECDAPKSVYRHIVKEFEVQGLHESAAERGSPCKKLAMTKRESQG